MWWLSQLKLGHNSINPALIRSVCPALLLRWSVLAWFVSIVSICIGLIGIGLCPVLICIGLICITKVEIISTASALPKHDLCLYLFQFCNCICLKFEISNAALHYWSVLAWSVSPKLKSSAQHLLTRSRHLDAGPSLALISITILGIFSSRICVLHLFCMCIFI